MAENTPLYRLAQIMGHDSLDTTMIYVKATQADLQQVVEKIAWGDKRKVTVFNYSKRFK